MKTFFDKFKNTILSGILFFLPVFFLVGLIQKLWNSLTGFGAKLASLVGVKSIAGIGAASLLTTILLILIFYICGLLVQLAFIGKFKSWIENTLLQYIPGYLTYKVKMEEKLFKKERKGAIYQEGITIDKLIDARFETGSMMLVGICSGAVLGGVLGYFMGDAVLFKSAPNDTKNFLKVLNTCLFAACGAIVGGLIGKEMKLYDSLNLWEIPQKDKQIKLIRFIREYEQEP